MVGLVGDGDGAVSQVICLMLQPRLQAAIQSSEFQADGLRRNQDNRV